MHLFSETEKSVGSVGFLYQIKKPMCSCGKCTCNGLRQFFELEAEDRVLQFLLGLNKGFVPVKGQMLSFSEVLPSLSKVFALIQ